MKSIKPILLVLAGVILTVTLFSFKNDEPTKEYVTMQTIGLKAIIIFPEGTEKEVSIKGATIGKETNIQINLLAKDGWELTEVAVSDTYKYYFFERTKR